MHWVHATFTVGAEFMLDTALPVSGHARTNCCHHVRYAFQILTASDMLSVFGSDCTLECKLTNGSMASQVAGYNTQHHHSFDAARNTLTDRKEVLQPQ